MFKKILKKLHLSQKGQGLVEYALILVLVAVVVIAILLTLGPAVSQVYCRIANSLQPGSCVGGGTIITSVTASPPSMGRVDVSFSVSQSISGITASSTIGTPQGVPASCNATCTFRIVGVGGSAGTVTVSGGGDSRSASWTP